MLKSTSELIEYLSTEKQESSVVHSYIKSILKLGCKEDAKLLLDSYLKHPFEFNHSYLLPVFQKFGDIHFAEKIYKNLFLDNQPKEFTDPKVLTLLADLKFLPIKKILFKLAFSDLESETQFKNEAHLGLLNFTCTEVINEIKLNIESLFELFYSWENPNLSNNLIDLARTVGKEEEAYEFEKQFEFKITEEIILGNFLVIFPASVTFDSSSH